MKPGDARVADMVWAGLGRVKLSNHGDDGHNVLYWDGHVAFSDTVYASSDPTDNIFQYPDELASGHTLNYSGNGSVWAWDGSSTDNYRENIKQVEEDAAIFRTHFDIDYFGAYKATL